MAELYGTEADESRRLKFHTQTAGQSLTAQQPLNNIARVTIQAMALPSEEAVRVTLRTQQIIVRSPASPTLSIRWAAVSPSGRFASAVRGLS